MGYYSRFYGEFSLSEYPSVELVQEINSGYKYDPWQIDGAELSIYGEEIKGYDRLPNLQKIMEIFIDRGIVANGIVSWQGEEEFDFGKIVIKNNEIFICEGFQDYHDPVPFKEKGRNS